MVWTKEQLQRLARRQNLLMGSRSASVWLKEQNVVEKQYQMTNPKQAERFHREVSILKHLQSTKLVPELYFVDEASGTLWMEYVGKNVSNGRGGFNLSSKEETRVNKMLAILKSKGVVRVKHQKVKTKLDALFPGNICKTPSGALKLIDFGSVSCWKLASEKWIKEHTQSDGWFSRLYVVLARKKKTKSK